jgi:hypothetical protein
VVQVVLEVPEDLVELEAQVVQVVVEERAVAVAVVEAMETVEALTPDLVVEVEVEVVEMDQLPVVLVVLVLVTVILVQATQVALVVVLVVVLETVGMLDR